MLNMNFTERKVVHTKQQPWQASPSSGVQRIPLERAAAESGHTTSIVEYLPNTSFAEHTHPHGEEIFVISGVFSDEHGDYPAGTYLRNPPGSSHAPFSRDGCIIFVKLSQFDERDLAEVRLNTNHADWLPGQGGLEVLPLHSFEHEHVALVKWPAGEVFKPHRHFGGEEILVLSGTFCDDQGHYPERTWLRNPHLSSHHPFVERETVIWVKTGHLPVI